MALMKGGFVFTALIIGCMTAASTGNRVLNGTVNATLGQSVTLPCVFNTNDQLDKNHMRIYWQYVDRQDFRVIKMYNKGAMDKAHLNRTYQDKAKIAVEEVEKGNFSLILDAVQQSDQRTYQTVFTYKDEKMLECTNRVHVGAEFSKPDVSVKSCVKSAEKVEEVEVACHAWGGLPKPSIRWSSNNRSVDQEVDNKLKLNSQNKTFIVWSHLTVNASIGQKYTCSIFNPTLGTTQENSVTVLPCPTPKQFFSTAVCVIVVTVMFIAAVLLVIFAFKKKNANRPEEGATEAVAAAGCDLETQKLQGNSNYENRTAQYDFKIV